MSYCTQCGTKVGLPGCFCPKIYPEEVKAFKSKGGHLYATPIEAVQADYRDKIDEWWLSDERLHSDPNSIQFLYRNMTKIAEILQGFPVKAKP